MNSPICRRGLNASRVHVPTGMCVNPGNARRDVRGVDVSDLLVANVGSYRSKVGERVRPFW